MEQRVGVETREQTTWDVVAEELQKLRQAAGSPSYASLAQLVADRRVGRGMTPDAARLARSTVHDYFKPGRSRGSLPLVRELVEALGADPELVNTWLARQHEASAVPETGSPAVEDADAHTVSDDVPPAQTAATARQACLLIVGCVLLNVLGRQFEEWLGLPVHLDMVGTAIAAIALGPWRGALVGAGTNVAGIAVSGLVSLPFALVNIAGALAWGYGVRRYGMGRTLPRFFTLNLLVALVCTLVAVPILVALYGGSTGHGQDSITDNISSMTHAAFVALAFSNLLVSVGDKMISGFVALVAVASLPESWRRSVPLAFVSERHSSER